MDSVGRIALILALVGACSGACSGNDSRRQAQSPRPAPPVATPPDSGSLSGSGLGSGSGAIVPTAATSGTAALSEAAVATYWTTPDESEGAAKFALEHYAAAKAAFGRARAAAKDEQRIARL